MKTAKKFLSVLLAVLCIASVLTCAAFAEEKYLPDDDSYFAIVDVLDKDEKTIATFYMNESLYTNPDSNYNSSREIYTDSPVTFHVMLKENVDFKIEQNTALDDTFQPDFSGVLSMTPGGKTKAYTLVEGDYQNSENRFSYQVVKNGETYHGEFTFTVYPAEYYCLSIMFKSSENGVYDFRKIYDYKTADTTVTFDMSTLTKADAEGTPFVWDYFQIEFTNFTKEEWGTIKVNGYDAIAFSSVPNSIAEGDNYYTIEFEKNGEKKSFSLILKNEEKTEWKNPFTDVSTSDSFYNSVKYCNMQSLILGTSDTTFSPDSASTRAMVVTLLYRIAGSPDVNGKNSFADVTAEDWFYNAVLWANANGIVTGYDSTHFGPNDNITREQFATILCRYAKVLCPDMEVYFMENMKAYAEQLYREYAANEGEPVSDYAFESMVLALNKGIVRTEDFRIAPGASVTRGDLAIGMAAMNITVLPYLEKSNILY